jgi:hypothetical protein
MRKVTTTHRHREGAFDLTTEVGTRLLAGLDSMPRKQQRRFRPAAQHAADALELAAPAVLAMTEKGLLAGLYSTVTPGHLAVVIADADGSIMFTPALSAIPDALKATRELMSTIPDALKPPMKLPGEGYEQDVARAVPLLLEAILECGKLSELQLGMLLLQPEHQEQIGAFAAANVTPAFVAMLSNDRTGSLRIVLPHARTMPPELGA